MPEEEYEIEYISQAKATSDDAESGELEWVYKVHWLGYPEDQATHEHDNGFFPELLDEFWTACGCSRDVKHHAHGTIIKPSQEYIGTCFHMRSCSVYQHMVPPFGRRAQEDNSRWISC
ncbi:hypothetical protein CALVIDRAFT_535808 [Calocera viscosa TUFC12733]|uniref:Chromo domain-containing protein n=1 Tax=Calocera viscosa (strain TUFC12733) TaxID=1330018 RepID=A0A167NH70_CALVF|nr:hypothetical protein CALVIDRAFT_535808 [Calocera viscosa TUFC12733]